MLSGVAPFAVRNERAADAEGEAARIALGTSHAGRPATPGLVVVLVDQGGGAAGALWLLSWVADTVRRKPKRGAGSNARAVPDEL